MKTKLSIILATVMLLGMTACAGGPQITDEQQDALAKLAGNGIAITLTQVKPEFIPSAQKFCKLFQQAKDAIEAKVVLENALTFLSEKYTGNVALGNVVINALKIIGFSEGQGMDFLTTKADEVVKIDQFTEQMYEKTMLVVTGFCEVIPK